MSEQAGPKQFRKGAMTGQRKNVGVTGVLPRKPLDIDVYTLAKQRMERIFDEFDQVAISFSGGKDSTAALNVALEVANSDPRFARHLPLRVIFYDEEAIPMQTEEYVRRVSQRPDVALEWYCLPVHHRNAASRHSPDWYPWAPEAEDLWCRPLPPEAITQLDGFPVWPAEKRYTIPEMNGLLAPPEKGNLALVMGIRAQESITRMRSVSRRATDNWIIPLRKGETPTARGNGWKVYPIYDWTTEDVWTAPALNGWDYNRCYDLMEMMGIPHHAQRCSPAFGEEPLGGLHMWAKCFPDVWEKMVYRVPGVGAAVRYARTEIWGYGEMPPKPAGMGWTDYLLKYITKFPKDKQDFIATRLYNTIHVHYRKTTHPILVENKHPDSGVSWNYLLRISMRGDFKKRNPPTMGIALDSEGRAQPKYWHKYAAELQSILEQGTQDELNHPGRFPDPAAVIPDYAKESE